MAYKISNAAHFATFDAQNFVLYLERMIQVDLKKMSWVKKGKDDRLAENKVSFFLLGPDLT